MAAICELASPACGVLAVGRCETCKRAFCESHRAIARMTGVPVVNQCTECQATQALVKEETKRSQEQELLSAKLAELRQIGDPMERLLAACRWIGDHTPIYNERGVPERPLPSTAKVRAAAEVCPEVANDSWDDGEVVHWFLLRAEEAGVAPNDSAPYVSRSLLGRRKVAHRPAWDLKPGSVIREKGTRRVFVYPDGGVEVVVGRPDRLTGSELRAMAELLGIT